MIDIMDEFTGEQPDEEAEPDLLDEIDTQRGVYIYTPELGVALVAIGLFRRFKTKVRHILGKLKNKW